MLSCVWICDVNAGDQTFNNLPLKGICCHQVPAGRRRKK
jgi:hypothetical protein